MTEFAIKAEGLGKSFTLRRARKAGRYRTLREDIIRAPQRLLRWLREARHTQQELFWALRDVSFTLKPGQVTGIIGRNGAGKSTLLKLLCRVLNPTCGEALVSGRVGSLLEVGTGFHPELTGRENIYLSGALLGMRRMEIRRRFDEIVAFAGVEKFVDVPCKHYSSGMYARLGFAVAAHLDSEVLLVDEVLAVGDVEFQKKCISKIESMSKTSERAVLFVSHDDSAIRRLCSRGIYLESGKLIDEGPVASVLSRYLADLDVGERTATKRTLSSELVCGIESVRIDGAAAGGASLFLFGAPIRLTLVVTARRSMDVMQVAVRVSSREGVPVLTTTNFDKDGCPSGIAQGQHQFSIKLPEILAPGHYNIIVALCNPGYEVFDAIESGIGFQIDSAASLGGRLNDGRLGCVEVVVPWEYRMLE